MFHSPCGLVGWFTKIKQISFYYFILFIPPPFFHSKKALTGMGMATQRCSAGGGGTFGVWQRPKSKVPCAPSAQSQPDAGPLRTFVFYWTKFLFSTPTIFKKGLCCFVFSSENFFQSIEQNPIFDKRPTYTQQVADKRFFFLFFVSVTKKTPPSSSKHLVFCIDY